GGCGQCRERAGTRGGPGRAGGQGGGQRHRRGGSAERDRGHRPDQSLRGRVEPDPGVRGGQPGRCRHDRPVHLPEPETGHRLCLRHHRPARQHVLRPLRHEGARDGLRRVRHHPGGGVLMAPPGRPDSRRVPRRRSAGDVLVGAGAVLILLVLLVGVPFALLTVLGPPIPHTVPALSLLTHRLDILAILKILSVVVWLAWLQLVVCLIAEVRAAVRNSGMPPRVPLAGGIQPSVHRLVTAALLLFSAATALSPAFVHQPPRLPSAVTSAPVGRGGGASPAATPSAAGPATLAPVGRNTQPPGLAGRDTGPPGSAGRDTGPPGPGGPGEPGGPGAPASGQGRPLEP